MPNEETGAANEPTPLPSGGMTPGLEPHLSADSPEFNDEIDPADTEPPPLRLPRRRQVLVASALVLTVLLLVLLPPLVNVNRYQRQIASSISASLGRPVRLNKVSLNLLPMPSFTLENFVVGEDPAFGSEPVIRASTVRATLRLSSLWQHRVEFSDIALDDASVNLVHLPDGRWNVEGILLQAARVPAAPTDQKVASEAPRFPYIEATNARINLKLGVEKMPLALTEARLALWLPEPNQWRLRLEGHPNRTDTAATDTGAFQVEGSLGHAASLAALPVDMDFSWTAAPLGAVSWVVLGRDIGLRGEATVHASVKGTIGTNRVDTRLELRDVRRVDFMPKQPLNADIACSAVAAGIFHRLDGIHCAWPPEAQRASAAVTATGPAVVVTGSIPQVLEPKTVQMEATADDVPLSVLLDGLRAASPRVAPEWNVSGTVSGKASCCGQGELSAATFSFEKARLALGDTPPFVDGDINGEATDGTLLGGPVTLNLGAPVPAVLDLRADWTGYTLHLTGSALASRLRALGQALPQFGDGLDVVLGAPPQPGGGPEQPIRLDATAFRKWFGPQTWAATAAPLTRPRVRHRR